MNKKYYILLLINISISLGMAYTPITKVDLCDNSLNDPQYYLMIFKGAPLTEIPKPYCYRFVVPYLARFIPSPPNILYNHFEIDEIKKIKFKFGILNAFGISLAALFLLKFCLYIKLPLLYGLLANFLFLTSFYIVNYSFLPMVDSFAYFSLIYCFYTIISDRKWQLALIFLIGVFIKETIIIGLFYIALRKVSRKIKLKHLLLCLPGSLCYLLVRYSVMPTDNGYSYTLQNIIEVNLKYFDSISSLVIIIVELMFSFGFLWILAYRGWINSDINKYSELHSMKPLLLLILILPFVLGTNLGRIWFLAFPVVIPLALVGLETCFKDMQEVTDKRVDIFLK